MKTLPSNFYAMPQTASMTMDEKDVRELLLSTNGWIMASGHLYDIETDHIAAGVYRVYLKRKKYEA